jgi:hypothetical protein
MTMPKAVARLLIAALLIAVAGPAVAKKQHSADGGYVVKKQSVKKGKSAKSKKPCVKTAPPFMYNPRYMNRGFFKCRNR